MRRSLYAILGLLALTAGGLAQETAPLKLTLRDAVNLALKQNPQVILANLGVARSEQGRQVARSELLPQAGADVSELQHRVNLQTAIGLSFPGFAQHVGPFEVFQSGVSFQAPVFDLTLWRRYRSSKLGVDASHADEMTAREESVLLVVSQYLGGQRAAADVQAAQSQVELAQALYDQAADLLKNGVGTGIDSLRANVQLQNQKQRLIMAKTQLDTTLFGLARLLNVDPHRQIELADQVAFSETPVTPVDQAIQQAYASRPELRQIALREQQADLTLRTAGDQRLPKVTVSGNWLEQGLTPNSVIPVYNYQASLDFPLFTGGRIKAQRADAGLAIRQLKQQEQDLRNRIALEVKTAAARLESAKNEVNVANQGIQLARQEVDQARDRFQAGVANNIEVITAQDELARANDNQIGALYRYNQARADLAHSVDKWRRSTSVDSNGGLAGRIAAFRGAERSHATVNPWLVAMTVMLATFMEVLDTTVVNVSLPHIAGSLSSTVEETTWALTAYLVSNAIILPMGGWFSMWLGRKRFYMICVALFTTSSFLCGVAPSLDMLILFRVMQGVGGGALQPVAQAILVESFPIAKRGMAMAVFGIGVVFAPIIGPTLGGWITDSYSWRWVFFINIPIGILALLLTSALVFDPPYLVRKTLKNGLKIDYIGFGLLALGLGSLEVVLDEGQKSDWFSSHFIMTFAVITLVALVSVVLWELHHKEPVIDFRVLKERNFMLCTLAMLVMGMVLYGSTTLMPLLLQTLLGYTAVRSGLVLSPGGLVVLFCMPLVGLLLRRIQPRWLIVFGVVACASGLFIMSGFNLYIDYRTAVWSRMVQSLGFGFLFVPISTAAFAYIAKARTQYATGLFNLARNIGGSIGIATVTTMLSRRSQFHQSRLVEHLTPFDPAYRQSLAGAAQILTSHGASPPDAARAAHGLIYGSMIRQAGMLSFVDTFWLMGVLFLAIIPLMLLIRNTDSTHRPVAAE